MNQRFTILSSNNTRKYMALGDGNGPFRLSIPYHVVLGRRTIRKIQAGLPWNATGSIFLPEFQAKDTSLHRFCDAKSFGLMALTMASWLLVSATTREILNTCSASRR